MAYASVFDTDQGMGVVLATARGISRVCLPHPDALLHSGLKNIVPSALTERAADMLKRYFRGEPQPFEKLPLDIAVSGDFRCRILELVRSIPFGSVRSYAQVALMAGSPGAARAVGGAMAANPVPIIIPCHRVVAADGRLTGFTAPGGLEMKKYLLKMERVEFKGERTARNFNVINR